ncbi:uncharacterized protein LOC6580191 [Drosophila mojavensis]|uniref:Enkurin domain-containing protein n=1 Tax=Drosophila mojavensis TaxID=7230 RepID=B4KND1_DROMO|nr:uncharacterized protein LOC6580191 [Drosophila mojavensis]EDW09984.1 uncharacterized protein Dmoj_GI18762 [Drosophila mojavensis]
MSNTTVRAPIPTLQGMFSVPRVTPGRNFLKENKKSLRSLEKTTTEKLAAKKPVRPKWMPPLRRTASEVREAQRCDSERLSSRHVDDEVCLLRPQKNTRSQHSLDKPQPDARESQKDKKARPTQSKSQSQLQPVQQTYPPQPQQQMQTAQQSSKRCQSCNSEHSSGTSIAIQTDDITDEIYLTNALKKCNLDSKTALSEGRNYRDDARPDYDYDQNYDQYNDEDEQPLSARSNEFAKQRALDIDDNETMPLPEIENIGFEHNDEEAPLSGRSRETIATEASNMTIKSKRRSEYKLGSRDDLRLPRYLEKEKREKAQAKERADSRDPDCPRGHVLMSEPERLAALAAAQNRFELLINELNHMPMTTQTLRVRSRKAEIDKELTSVEDEIRIYSKAKVYVKAAKSRNL